MTTVTIVSLILFVIDYGRAEKEVAFIERKGYGEGSISEELEIIVDGRKQQENIEIEISERQYTEEEIQKIFERAIQKLEKLMLGENKGMDQIRTGLNLINKIPEEPVLVEWEIDRYDVINFLGEINYDAIEKEEGVLVELKAYLRYEEDETRQLLHIMNVMVCPKEKSKEQVYELIKHALEDREESFATAESIELPEEVNGKKITYKRPLDSRSMVLLVWGTVCSVLIWCMEGQRIKEQERKKEEQMMCDYPEIISKLNLLLGTGITVKNAWKKIIEDYEKQKNIQEMRYAYEEMANTYREMQSGVLEAECYEHFGRNCKLRPYLKLGALLSQNLRKGTKGLTGLLNLEAIQAYEERKIRAKRLGEEAGTKLLLPMFLMLMVVLVIVIMPAFLAIRV